MADQDNTFYLWWMWLSRPENEHHAINFAIHTFWHVQSASAIYNEEVPVCLLAWRSTMPHILSGSDYTVTTVATHAATFITGKSRGHFHRVQSSLQWPDTARDIAICALIGPTIGTLEIDDWSRTDNQGNDTLWLDHSIAMNESANRMAHECVQCGDNAEHKANDIRIQTVVEPQYVTADNGLEVDHNAAMSLHKWHTKDNDAILTNRHITMDWSRFEYIDYSDIDCVLTSLHFTTQFAQLQQREGPKKYVNDSF
eukprot:103335-Amphidinium_carterae.2